MANPGHRQGYTLEYRDKADDSWYSVRVELEKETMTVKYEGYPEYFDVKFNVGDFKSKEEVEELIGRFRYVSPQLQDSECGSLKEGMIVCVACNAFGLDDMLYYDSEIEAIHKVDHSFVNGEEQCLCTFVVSWLHGPKEGYLTSTRIEGICSIKGVAQVDPRITSFLELVNQNLRKSSCKLISASKYEGPASKGSSCEKEDSNLSIPSSFEGINSAGSTIDVAIGDNNYSRKWNHDKDLGGHPNLHLLLIDNLEKDLLPSSFSNFIREHTSVSSQAYIFPNPSVPYASGMIVVDCEEKLQKIYQFLDNPAHLIVSSTGRPLVITERDVRHDMIGMWARSLGYKSQDICFGTRLETDLMLVQSGTEAYKSAKQLKDLFLEFTNHQQPLYKKFSEEEMRILQTNQQFNQSIILEG